MYESIQKRLIKELDEVKISGRFKNERMISSVQQSEITVNNKEVLNFCANNYLGLAANKDVINKAKKTLDNYGVSRPYPALLCNRASDMLTTPCHVSHPWEVLR